MIFLYVLLFILLLILLIFSIKINLYLGFDGNLKFTVRILFYKFKLNIPVLYKPKKAEEEKEYAQEKKQQKSEVKKTSKEEEKLPFPGIKKAITFFKDSVISLFGKAIGSFKLEKMDIRAVAASSDAAKTAEMYGFMCTAAAAIHQFVLNAKRVKKDSVFIEVRPDFLAETADFYADIHFSIRVWKIFYLAINGISIWQNYKKLARSSATEKAANEEAQTDSSK